MGAASVFCVVCGNAAGLEGAATALCGVCGNAVGVEGATNWFWLFTGKSAAGVVPLLFDAPGQAGLAVGVPVVVGADDGGVGSGDAEALGVVGRATAADGNGDADSEGGDSMFVAGIAGL